MPVCVFNSSTSTSVMFGYVVVFHTYGLLLTDVYVLCMPA
jgi:hypothetical protein